MPITTGPSLPDGSHRGQSRIAYKARDVVFRQGDPSGAVFQVVKGTVKLVVESEQGKVGIIGLLGPGDFFGLAWFADKSDRKASVVALTDSIVIRFEKDTVERALREQGAFAQALTKFLLVRNRQIEDDLIDHLFSSSERRLARALVQLAGNSLTRKGSALIERVSQDTLAARVGTTRSRINRFMNKFRRLGYIDYNGGIHVRAALLDVLVRE